MRTETEIYLNRKKIFIIDGKKLDMNSLIQSISRLNFSTPIIKGKLWTIK